MEDKNIKFLLVEDDPMIWDLYEQAFRLKGYTIEVAVDGDEAIKKLDTMDELPSLVLLDIMMPKVDGLDVLRHIKASNKLKGITVVMLTNLSESKSVEEALKLGAVRYLVKQDYTPNEIVGQVEDVIAQNFKSK